MKDIENLADPTTGELRIAGSEPIVAGLFPAVIERVSREYPRFVFHVTCTATDLPEYRALRERDVEFIVGRLPRLESQEDLQVNLLFEDPLVVAAGVNNPWARRRSIELAELMDESWVLPPSELFIGSLITHLFHACGLERPRNGVVCSSLHMNDALLATGRYLAIYSRSRLRLGRKRLPIKILPVKFPVPTRPIGIVTLKNRTLSPIANLFTRHMREIVRSLDRGR